MGAVVVEELQLLGLGGDDLRAADELLIDQFLKFAGGDMACAVVARVVLERDAQPIQVVAILIGHQYDALVADGHLDGIHLIGGEYGVLGDIYHAHGDGKLPLVGVVECQ